MTRDVRVVACLWHQRTAAIDTRERLLATLSPGDDRLLLETCHRVELYAAVPKDVSVADWIDGLGLDGAERDSLTVAEDAAAAAHLFAVAAGLDSAVAGEPQILRQVGRAYRETATPHPLLARLFERALHVGRETRRLSGLASDRSVGSLAVDALAALVPDSARATVLVVGAGEMGKLAVRSLARRVGRVIVANRDRARADAIAAQEHATAIPLASIAEALPAVDAIVSAADTRGDVLTPSLLGPRIARGPLVVVDIAVPRSVGPDARALPGLAYRSVDDLPGASAQAPDSAVRAARARCAEEARLFLAERAPASVEAIRALRDGAERVRAEKLERALQRLAHLSPRDRRVVEALSTTLTNALMHEPLVALRENRADPAAARALFERDAK